MKIKKVKLKMEKLDIRTSKEIVHDYQSNDVGVNDKWTSNESLIKWLKSDGWNSRGQLLKELGK